jgi:hypothetical protein
MKETHGEIKVMSHMKMEEEPEVMLPQARKTWSHPKLERTRKNTPLETCREHGPANT